MSDAITPALAVVALLSLGICVAAMLRDAARRGRPPRRSERSGAPQL